MPSTTTLEFADQLDIEAEILRSIWYEGKATPDDLSRELNQDPLMIDTCLDDLVQRNCIFQYFKPESGHDDAIYCLTKRANRKLERSLVDYDRYKLRAFWLSFARDDVVWLSRQSHS